MDISSETREQIAAEAADWFLYFQSSDRSAKDRQAFSEWLTRSPLHVEEYLALSATWTKLLVPDAGEFATSELIAAARASGRTDEALNVVKLDTRPVSDPQPDETRVRNRHFYRWVATAACAVFICGAWFGYDRWYRSPDIRTAVGEQRSLTLSDGSVVILNTNSEVRVRWTATERQIELIKGEGQFHVAKNPDRPFIVSTANATVLAVGTVFNVRSELSGTQVAVLEGRVNVHALAPKIPSRSRSGANRGNVGVADPTFDAYALDAGRRVAVTVHGIEQDTGPSVEAVAAWTQRRLVFRDQRLADVVAEFNRYRLQPLVVDDVDLAGLKISGVFELSDPESLLVYLKSFETVNVELSDDGSLHLARNAAKFDVRK